MGTVITRGLIVGLIGVAASLVGVVAPAQAAACPKGTGVTVVVGSSVDCDAGGGGTAADNFRTAGHTLTYAKRQPGFVCRVNGAPSSDPCVNASPSDAFWGLYWSNGSSGSWIFSNSGAGSLRVPQGGWVALVFQDGGKKQPGVRPIGPAPKPKPKPKPTAPKAKTPEPTSTPKASASPSVTADVTDSAEDVSEDDAAVTEPGAAPGSVDAAAAGKSEELEATSAQPDQNSSVLLWVAAVLGVALVGAAVVIGRARSQRQ